MDKRKKKKKYRTFDIESLDIDKMKQERKAWFDAMKEIEELKKSYYDIKFDETLDICSNEEFKSLFSRSLIVDNDYVGKKVFDSKFRYQCFTTKDIVFPYHNFMYDYEKLKNSLALRLILDATLSKKAVRQLYFLMSIEDDDDIIDLCYQKLIKNLITWTPKLRHVLKILLNWGATCDSLGLTCTEKRLVLSKEIVSNPSSENPLLKFRSLNFQKIFDYLREVIVQKDKYIDSEKIILLKCLLRIALDKQFVSFLPNVQECISVCIESFKNWDNFKIVNICALLHDINDHFHNQVIVITDILPRYGKCKDIISCLSLALLRILVNSEPKYEIPFEVITEVDDLLMNFRFNINCTDELYKFYVTIHLLNFIIFQERVPERHESVLDNIKRKVEAFNTTLSQSIKTFDCELVKSRMNYCSALWSVSKKKSTNI